MKFFDKEKSAQMLSDLMHKTVDISKKAVDGADKGIRNLVEKSKQDSYDRKVKRLNPLFPDRYHSAEFALPNIIKIVDDAERRGEAICDGAIGWTAFAKETEVLYLYDEFVPECEITFVPVATCNTVYCVDPYDRKRFISTESVFTKANEERVAELKHIAHALGAKRCAIEITEEKTDANSRSFSVNLNMGGNKSNTQHTAQIATSQKSSGRIEAEFAGSDTPMQPTLKWFAKDDTMKRLIEARFDSGNTVKSETLQLAGRTSATMSQATACAIDAVKNVKGSASMSVQATKEHQSTLLFHIEF